MSHRSAIRGLPYIFDSALTKCFWILPAIALQVGCSGAEDVDADPDVDATDENFEPKTGASSPEAVDSQAAEPEAELADDATSSETSAADDAADHEIGTLGQALAPLCVVPTRTSGGGVTVNNNCGFETRIRVIWGFAPDSECIHLFVDDGHHFNRPHSSARFDGLDDC